MKKAPNNLQAGGAFGEQLTLLDPPPFCPSWPKNGTLADKALRLLLDGKAFNHPDFQGDSDSWRLAAYVGKLRELGWPIQTIKMLSPSRKNPGRTIARYQLPSRYIAQALASSRGVQL